MSEQLKTNTMIEQPKLQATSELIAHARAELGRVISGQTQAIEEVLIAVLCQGHALLEGVPGIAKTLMVKTLGRLLGLGFQRVQATPDLMPADILGTTILRPGTDSFTFHAGPVFTDLLLVDEINRMPPRTQAALLECMEERQVTSDGTRRPLPCLVHRLRNAEPGRLRRHVSPAGGATRPLPDEDSRRISHRSGRVADS